MITSTSWYDREYSSTQIYCRRPSRILTWRTEIDQDTRTRRSVNKKGPAFLPYKMILNHR